MPGDNERERRLVAATGRRGRARLRNSSLPGSGTASPGSKLMRRRARGGRRRGVASVPSKSDVPTAWRLNESGVRGRDMKLQSNAQQSGDVLLSPLARSTLGEEEGRTVACGAQPV